MKRATNAVPRIHTAERSRPEIFAKEDVDLRSTSEVDCRPPRREASMFSAQQLRCRWIRVDLGDTMLPRAALNLMFQRLEFGLIWLKPNRRLDFTSCFLVVALGEERVRKKK